MYGRRCPAPAPPAFSRAERAALAAAAAAEAADRAAVEGGGGGLPGAPPASAAARAWAAVLAAAPDGGLGAACPALGLGLAWRQGAGVVEVHARAPASCAPGFAPAPASSTFRPVVALTPTALSIAWEGGGEGDNAPHSISGTLAHPITPADCAWTLCDGVLCVTLAKKKKRGGEGAENEGDPSFWRALFAGDAATALPAGPVPPAYAALPVEDDGVAVARPALRAA